MRKYTLKRLENDHQYEISDNDKNYKLSVIDLIDMSKVSTDDFKKELLSKERIWLDYCFDKAEITEEFNRIAMPSLMISDTL